MPKGLNGYVAPPPKPTPKNADEPDLPASLPGLHPERALRRLGGNQALFRRLLRTFAQEYAHTPEWLTQALAQQDWALAARLVHTLKGAAGHLAAESLHGACLELEKALKSGHMDDLDAKTQALLLAHALVLESALSLGPVPEKPSAASEPHPSDEGPTHAEHAEEDAQLFSALAAQLRINSLDAEFPLEELLRRHPNGKLHLELTEIQTHFQAFRFREAEAALHRMLGDG